MSQEVADARRIGTLSLVEPGQTAVYSSERTNHRGDHIGGVVLRVDDRADPETGEVVRSFLVVDPFNVKPRVTFDTVTEAEVNQDGVEAVGTARLVFLVRRMCEQVGKSNSKFMDTREADMCLRWVPLLTRAVCGQSGLTP